MDVSLTLSALLIAGALGALAGSTLSVAGWVATSALLALTLAVSAGASGAAPLVSLGLGGLAILGFNAGLVAGLLPRARALRRA